MPLDHRFVYDADCHVATIAEHASDLPAHLVHRRPRAIEIGDAGGLGIHTSTFLWDGRIQPSLHGPGANPGNWPGQRELLEKLIADTPEAEIPPMSWGAQTLLDPEARIRENALRGIDRAVIYPSTVYALVTHDPELLAAYYRSYNRFVGRATAVDRTKLQWAGLLPLAQPEEALLAVEEMLELGASAATVYGTVGDRLLSEPAFAPVFAELERVGLPLAVHAGQSYSPLEAWTTNQYRNLFLTMVLPAQLAFAALAAGGVLDRHPTLKVGFFEFGSEWLIYQVEHGDKYRDLALDPAGYHTDVPQQAIADYTRSDRFFLSAEADGKLLPLELEYVGEDGWLFASDIPHGEGREDAAKEILERTDLTEDQKTKLLGANAERFYRQP